MLDHHIQRAIIYQLAFTQHARFSELKPAGIDNKLFTYHLKKVLAAGYVIKDDEGLYALTSEGRRLGTGALEKQQRLVVERAHSVLFLVIRRKQDGAWLFYRRSTYPMLGFAGFMHCNPNSTTDSATAAHAECLEKTGLDGTFSTLGGGYFRIYENGNLESFTHFTLLFCDDIQGELQPHDHRADYFWVTNPDLETGDAFPGTELLMELYNKRQPFFTEKTFTIERPQTAH